MCNKRNGPTGDRVPWFFIYKFGKLSCKIASLNVTKRSFFISSAALCYYSLAITADRHPRRWLTGKVAKKFSTLAGKQSKDQNWLEKLNCLDFVLCVYYGMNMLCLCAFSWKLGCLTIAKLLLTFGLRQTNAHERELNYTLMWQTYCWYLLKMNETEVSGW